MIYLILLWEQLRNLNLGKLGKVMKKVMECHGVLKASKGTNPVFFFLNVLFKRSYPRDIEWFLANDLARELFRYCNAHKPGWDGKGKLSLSSFTCRSKCSIFKCDEKVRNSQFTTYFRIFELVFMTSQRWQILCVVEHCFDDFASDNTKMCREV